MSIGNKPSRKNRHAINILGLYEAIGVKKTPMRYNIAHNNTSISFECFLKTPSRKHLAFL